MTIQEQRRKAFEAHYSKKVPGRASKFFIRDGDKYLNPDIQRSWVAWNAALDSLEVALPAKLETQRYARYERGWNDALLETADAIESAGVRVKR